MADDERNKWISHVDKFDTQILENLDLPGLLVWAQQHGGLSKNQIELIQGPQTSHPTEQVRRFIQMFKDMTHTCMQHVINGLARSGQHHIGKLITEG